MAGLTFFVPPKEWLPLLRVTDLGGENKLELPTLPISTGRRTHGNIEVGLYGQNLGGWLDHRRTTTHTLLEN